MAHRGWTDCSMALPVTAAFADVLAARVEPAVETRTSTSQQPSLGPGETQDRRWGATTVHRLPRAHDRAGHARGLRQMNRSIVDNDSGAPEQWHSGRSIRRWLAVSGQASAPS